MNTEKPYGIKIPIANIFNEAYSEDIRRKTQASIDALITSGKFVAPRAPFGYMKSEEDCHQLVVDEAAAPIIKKIFRMAFENTSLNEIVGQLNVTNTLTPMKYAIGNGLAGNYKQGDNTWNSRSLKSILTNRTYTGDLMQGKNNILLENTHEALVERDQFLKLQERFEASNITTILTAPSDNPLKGKVICGTCGGKMQRRKNSGSGNWYYFTCITNNRKGCGCDTGMYMRESEIKTAITGKNTENIITITINADKSISVSEV